MLTKFFLEPIREEGEPWLLKTVMNRPDKQPVFFFHPRPDRRRYPRWTLQVPIELLPEGSGTILSAETTDLSRNGCYLRLPEPLSVGHWIEAILWLAKVPIQVGGRVVTRHPDLGNGIMFLQIQGRDEQALATYLEAVTAESAIGAPRADGRN